jgi:thiamine biosynthesis lipoprotein
MVANEALGDARHACKLAFEEIDRVESELSHYIGTSDAARINRMDAGTFTSVSGELFDCLKIARQVHRDTGGAFDITIGALLKGRRYWRTHDEHDQTRHADARERRELRTGMDLLLLDEEHRKVGVKDRRVSIDLGGIGKGFALDRAMGVLKDWDIERVLVHGGQSTFLAAGGFAKKTGWPMRILDPRNEKDVLGRYALQGRAVSASAPGPRKHILDPRTGKPPDTRWVGAWSMAPSAALADALSTAFMIMKDEEIKRYCRAHPRVCAVMVAGNENKPEVRVFGDPDPYRFKWKVRL